MDDRIPGAELELLKALWNQQPQSARELAESAYGGTSVVEIGTVQKLLQRLEAKGLVVRDRTLHVHRFSAAVTRDEFAGRQFESLAGKLTDGSLAPILMHLVQSRKLSKRERDELKRILEGDQPRGAT